MAFLELKDVSKAYRSNGTATPVLRDINLSIEKGEFVAIVGYSGSGKTTLISLIAGLIRPDTGSVTLDGAEIRGPSPERGIVFQNYSLLPWLTTYENVYLAVDQVFPKWSADKKKAHTEKYIGMVNLLRAREKRAKIIHAEGELQASEKLAQAAHVIATEPITIQLRYLQTLTEIGTEKNSTIIFPLPIDLLASFMASRTGDDRSAKG